MNGRSYNQFCALAYALDAVGERWTLLIIRELLTGPRRFTDLIDGLPGISSNLLSERLKGLMQQGIISRRLLPPPAGSTVYELTPLGLALESPVLELGKWGSHFLPASLEGVALPSLGAMALAIKAFFHPEQAQGVNETYELHLGNEVLQVQVKEGELQVQQGAAQKAGVVFHTDMQVFVGLFAGQIKPEEAISGGLIRIEGDRNEDNRFEDERFEDELSALSRFFKISGVPGSAFRR
jgi:DNA-binding HxlR family transcriptional regulator/putative sterol carrier protein